MKRWLLLLGCVVSAPIIFAHSNWENFSEYATPNNVHSFTKDLGGIIGSGTYTTGRILGWGGFQIGPRGTVAFKMSKVHGDTKEERNATALGDREKVGAIFYPWLQADIGLPFRIDGFIRASSYEGMTIAGGGLRWGITRPSETVGAFQPMLVVTAHSASARDFSATHYNASLVLSMKFKHFVPYVGGGVDYTTLHINGVDHYAEMEGSNDYATTARGTLGFNFKLPSYMDLSLAAHYAHYGMGGEASLTVRF